MSAMGIAIGLHVLGVVWWIGGLAFVTLVFLPLLRGGRLGDIQAGFQLVESRFAPQVKTALVLVGATGLYMLIQLDAWNRFAQLHYWWLTLMVIYWFWFALMLFVLGPTGLLKRIMKGSGGNPERAWKRLHIVHGVLLLIGLIIVAGAIAGAIGY